MQSNLKRLTIASLAVGLLAVLALFILPKQESAEGPENSHQQDAASRDAVIKKTDKKSKPVAMSSSDPYWQRALEEIDRSPEEIAAQVQREERHGLYLPKLIRGNPREKLLALTFDDGPHVNFTEKLLNLLKTNDVKATFFVVGKMVEKNPQLLKDIV